MGAKWRGREVELRLPRIHWVFAVSLFFFNVLDGCDGVWMDIPLLVFYEHLWRDD